jgi:hypothetical protein
MEKRCDKGMSLIIVVFAMMLFGILGWTLAMMQSADFQQNERNLDTERALFLANAGAQWALKELSQNTIWRTDVSHGYAGGFAQHTLSGGQYRVVCRDPQGTEQGNVVIVATGYIPAVLNYRALREVKITVVLGNFSNALQAHTLFNWSAMHTGSNINGHIQANSYEADGDGIYNEIGVDYSDVVPVLPPDGTGDTRVVAAEPYPLIDMPAYEAAAGSRVWNLASTATVAAIGPGTRVRVSSNIFTTPASQWENVTIMRNMTTGTWDNQNWRVITRRISDNTVELESNVAWTVGDQIKIVKRFAENHNDERLWYIKGDVLFDLRNQDVRFRNTGVAAEGDIIVKGNRRIDFDNNPSRYANLATQNGNIISTDTPTGGNDTSRRANRRFGNAIYTQNGDIIFNYLDGLLLTGNNVTLDGQIRLTYRTRARRLTGFAWGASEIKWKEQ